MVQLQPKEPPAARCLKHPGRPARPAHLLPGAQVKGKVTSVAIDSCTKVGVVFEDVIAACEVVNCSRVKVGVRAGCRVTAVAAEAAPAARWLPPSCAV